MSHDCNPLGVPVNLREMFRRFRHVRNLRTGGMQSDDPGVRCGDDIAIDGEAPKDDLIVDTGRTKEGPKVVNVRDLVSIGYNPLLCILAPIQSVAESLTRNRRHTTTGVNQMSSLSNNICGAWDAVNAFLGLWRLS